MSDDSEPLDPRLLTLMGDAARILAKANVPSEAIGLFMLEYPASIRANLAPPPAPVLQEIDIEAVVAATLEAQAKLSRSPEDASATRGKRGVSRIKRNVTVNGKRTTIRLRTELYERMVQISAQKADQQLQELLDRAPEDHPNRTAWVEERIRDLLILAEVRPGDQAPH